MKKIITVLLLLQSAIAFTQNVGINNTNPQASLDLQGDLRLRSASLVVNNGVYSSLDITTQKSSTYILTRPVGIPPFGVTTISGINGGIDGRVVTFFNNSPDIRIVSETGSLTSNIPANRINTGTNEEVLLHKWGSIVLRYDGVLSRWTVQNSNNTSGLVNSSSSPWLRNSTNPFDIYTNYPGNVGIGTSTPTNKLQINTDVSNYGLVHTDGTIAIGTYVGGNTAVGGWLGTKSNHSLYLFANDGGPAMTVATNGNIGIGTTTPPYKLSVNGNIICEELKVQLKANWPDYVFGDNYKLLPLLELEKNIKANKHLPNIPSAADVTRANGIDIGEMNRKLVEKVEELTLYLIELKKENEAIKQRILKIENK